VVKDYLALLTPERIPKGGREGGREGRREGGKPIVSYPVEERKEGGREGGREKHPFRIVCF